MKGVTGDYPLRRQLAAEGLTVPQAAERLGINRVSLAQWARRHGVAFALTPGRRSNPNPFAERFQAAADGLSLTQAAQRLGLNVQTLKGWATRAGVKFVDGRSTDEARRAASQRMRGRKVRVGKGGRPRLPKPPKVLRPLTAPWFAARLTETERADYRLLRLQGGQTALEALAAIRRPDLVAEVTAHLHARAAAPAETPAETHRTAA